MYFKATGPSASAYLCILKADRVRHGVSEPGKATTGGRWDKKEEINIYIWIIIATLVDK